MNEEWRGGLYTHEPVCLCPVHARKLNLHPSNPSPPPRAQDTTTFRAIVRAVEADVDEAGQRQAGRTEVLPVQWRRIVDLEVDAVAQRLVPPGIAGLRQVLHATVVEVLLFLTPRHRERMVDAVVRSLNAQYSRFVARNPGFQVGWVWWVW